MAAPVGSLPDMRYLGTFAVGAFVMRGAGCTINDMWDVKYDRQVCCIRVHRKTIHPNADSACLLHQVERTKSRPLARGDVTMKQAWAFLAAQLTTGLGILCTLNPYSYESVARMVQLGSIHCMR